MPRQRRGSKRWRVVRNRTRGRRCFATLAYQRHGFVARARTGRAPSTRTTNPLLDFCLKKAIAFDRQETMRVPAPTQSLPARFQ